MRDVVALIEQHQHGCRDGCHSTCKRFSIFSSFHRTNFLGDSIRIHRGQPGIKKRVLSACSPSSVAFFREFVGRREEDRCVHRISNMVVPAHVFGRCAGCCVLPWSRPCFPYYRQDLNDVLFFDGLFFLWFKNDNRFRRLFK